MTDLTILCRVPLQRASASRPEVTTMTSPRASSSRSRLALASVALAATASLAACGGEGPTAAQLRKPSAHARTALSAGCADVTVHDKHANRFTCTACHPVGGGFGFAVPYTFPKGTTTAGGVLVRGTATTPTTCSVGCHHPNAPVNEITWNAPGPLACTSCHAASALPDAHPPVAADATRADCEGCHVTTAHGTGAVALVSHAGGWADPAASTFHAAAANRGLAECQGCHGRDLAGSSVARGCGACHDQTTPSFVSWKVRCTMCHGGVDDDSGAPPKATWGNAGDAVRTGAHSAHLHASAIAPAFECGACHLKPQDALATAHLDPGPAEVTFGGPAVIGGAAPAWDRAAATCASTYCHGSAEKGGTNASPTWTRVGQGEAACGSCHGLPPPAPHPTVSAELTGCTSCHDVTMNAAGELIAPSTGGKHLDGVVQSGGHPDAWKDPASGGFHAYAADRGLASCQPCHGTSLDGVGAPVAKGACATCHGASWSTTCTMCHGGVADATGAPPKATWGNGGDAPRVGAHGAHVNAGAVAAAFDCGTCHVKPVDAFAAGHLDGGTAEVTFGGLAILGSSPAWDRAGATCASTYCHGSPAKGASNPTPTWTRVGQGEAACGACHGLPPPPPHPVVSTDRTRCWPCHDKTMDSAGALVPWSSGGKHLDGTVQSGGHPPEWMDRTSTGFHAVSANRGLEGCASCHGATLDGGAARACSSCHGATWKTGCTMCHGGVDNQTGAPPTPTWGKDAEPVRVGAHTRHVAGGPLTNPIACVACHPQPADALSSGHVDAQEYADVTFSGIAAQGITPIWNRASATCVTYCHGAGLPGVGTNRTPVWTGGAAQAVCGSCHGIPPNTGGHWHIGYGLAECGDCHPRAYPVSVDRARHLNGRIDVGVSIFTYQNRTCTNACHSAQSW